MVLLAPAIRIVLAFYFPTTKNQTSESRPTSLTGPEGPLASSRPVSTIQVLKRGQFMADELDDLPDGEAPRSPQTPAATQIAAKKAAAKSTPAPRREPEEEDDEPPPQKHRHTPGMMQLALHFGYSQADIDGTTPADLRSELQLLQTEVSRSAPKPAPEKKPAPIEPVDEEEEYLKVLEANPEIDKEHVKFLRKIKAKADAAEKKANKYDEIEERDKKRDVARHVEMVDNSFAGLPKKFHKLFGTDGMAELKNPGMRGWRMEVVNAANLQDGDSQRTIDRKIATAAAKVSTGHVEEDEEEEDEPINPYAAKPKKKTPLKDPATGRFTEEDFERGHVAKPSVKKIAAGEMDAVTATRNLLRQNGDPRGFRTPVEFEDDLPEG